MENEILSVQERGLKLLCNPALNKGTAFSLWERKAFGLAGLLPPAVCTIEAQMERVIENFRAQRTPLDKYIYLRLLQDRNETLFHAVLMRYISEMTPIVYTPTVGDAVKQFSHIFRSARGLHFTSENIDDAEKILHPDNIGRAAVIVVTDNEGILGIGDQGAGGIGIPIGKLALYVAAGGFHPSACLPISLDVGTDNEELLADPLYLGVRKHRMGDDEYARFIERFVDAVRKQQPQAVLQWEDLSRQRAFQSLELYRDVVPSFNDDIQGTASVVYAALCGALRCAGRELANEKIIIVGAGAAGVGVSSALISALEVAGLSPEQARQQVFIFDSRGLVVAGRGNMPPYKMRIAADPAAIDELGIAPEETSVLELIQKVHPGTLIGLSGQPGAFNREIIEAMAEGCDRPIIFPLSNPSANVEARPGDVIKWTRGRAIVTTGSPFEPVEFEGRTITIPQVNNVYIFPGVGAGAYLGGATTITDAMMVVAGAAVSDAVSDEDIADGRLLPTLDKLREVSVKVAAATMRQAAADGVANPELPDDLESHVADWQYQPHYKPYKPV